MVALALVAAAVQTVRTTSAADRPLLPQQEYAKAVTSILGQLTPRIAADEVVRIEGAGDYLNESWVGMRYGISQRDRHFYTSDGAAGQKWGEGHSWKDQRVDQTLTVAMSVTERYDDAIAKCDSEPQQKRVASYDQLTPTNRLKLRSLLAENYAAGGHLPKAVEARLISLNQKVFRVVVFEGARTYGT